MPTLIERLEDEEMYVDAVDEAIEYIQSLEINSTSWFYKNCRRRRGEGAKICQSCPFRGEIERQEKEWRDGN